MIRLNIFNYNQEQEIEPDQPGLVHESGNYTNATVVSLSATNQRSYLIAGMMQKLTK